MGKNKLTLKVVYNWINCLVVNKLAFIDDV